ncbi:MAG TPA: hypothetical protein DD381_03060 [Lentisphaeria bacterium]|nr:MAG: hypothetical protein A2X47_03195 [Lentisphaerae bacterium GWF2_38_69]HBM15313.1 hypothetical protein [Lentisphaeria bacterium]
MKLVITGPKCSGKSILGKGLADLFSIPFHETDLMIEDLYIAKYGSSLSCRAICSQYGEDFFRTLEKEVIANIGKLNNCIISTGGSTMLNKDSRMILRENSFLILITVSLEILFKRLSAKEIPGYLNNKAALDMYAARACLVTETVKPFADILVDSSDLSYEETINGIVQELLSLITSLRKSIAHKLKFLEDCQTISQGSEINKEPDLNILKLALKL